MDQATLASQIALTQALTHERLAGESLVHSESVAHRTTSKQLLKAAAELQRGNLPVKIVVDGRTYYIVESRSTFIGRLVDLDVSLQATDHIRNVILHELRDWLNVQESAQEVDGHAVGDVTLKFCVTGGDPYLVDIQAMSCTCKRGPGELCWHYTEAEVWEEAGRQIAALLPKPEVEYGYAYSGLR